MHISGLSKTVTIIDPNYSKIHLYKIKRLGVLASTIRPSWLGHASDCNFGTGSGKLVSLIPYHPTFFLEVKNRSLQTPRTEYDTNDDPQIGAVRPSTALHHVTANCICKFPPCSTEFGAPVLVSE